MVDMIFAVLLGGTTWLLLNLYHVLVLKPWKLRSKLQNQGIRGPPPSFFLGNIPEIKRIKTQAVQSPQGDRNNHSDISHDWFPTLFPHLEKWRNEYGSVFLYATGNLQILCITDMEIAKEISLRTSLSLGKPTYISNYLRPLLGKGILASNGPMWAHQRKIIAPEFFPEKVKGMVKLMGEATTSLLRNWESQIDDGGGVADFRVDNDLRRLAADIISKTAFESSYSKGEEIFSKLQSLQKVMSAVNIGIPGLRYLPTKSNRKIWKLEKEIDSMILEVVKERLDGGPQEQQDLLQQIAKGAKSCGAFNHGSSDISEDRFIIDNCKNMYFAGHETTANTLAWSLMLLAVYPDWQDRVRAEVLETCKSNIPNTDELSKMKTLTMVIQEVLRLYSPATFVLREVLEDINIKGILIPKGMTIQIPKAVLLKSLAQWGPDATKFNPERFANGVTGACKTPQAYLPFGMGPRICAGQHFAMTELKVILSLILSRFSFSLSPEYRHSPAVRMVIEPEHGVHLQMKRTRCT